MSDQIMRRAAALTAASGHADAAGPVIRRSSPSSAGLLEPFPGATPTSAAALDLDELVDAVVERIEQRVVDELERRGRRLSPGAF